MSRSFRAKTAEENANLNHLIKDENNSMSINSLGLLDKFNWYENFDNHWNVGERGSFRKITNIFE